MHTIGSNSARDVGGSLSRAYKALIYYRYLYLMLVPGLVLIVLFRYLPIYGITVAFKEFNPLHGVFGSRWAGLEYFRNAFDSMFFWRVFRNTLIINLYQVVFAFPVPIVLALLMNEMRWQPFKRTIQTVTYLPHFLSWVIVGGFVLNILSPNGGIVNQVRALLGSEESVHFLLKSQYFRGILVASGIWKNAGWQSIIYLAAIAGVNPELYDAAIVDGAGKLRQALNITLPSILPTIAVLLVLKFGNMLSMNFEQVLVLYSPNVYETGDIISTYVYRIGIGQAKYSFTTAIGVFQSVINFVLIVAANRFARRMGSSLW